METQEPAKTITMLFQEFLADQEARLSPASFNKYKNIIHLYQRYLESYWPDHSGDEYNRITKAKGTDCNTFGAKEIVSGFSEFLGYFMPYKVIAGNETMKAAGTVTKKLAKWLVAKGYTKEDEAIRDMVTRAARDLPASQKLLDKFDDWLAESAPLECEDEVAGHFWVSRVEVGQLWLDPILGGRTLGPIPVPEKISRACQEGWDIGGCVGKTAQGWRLIEGWNIAP